MNTGTEAGVCSGIGSHYHGGWTFERGRWPAGNAEGTAVSSPAQAWGPMTHVSARVLVEAEEDRSQREGSQVDRKESFLLNFASCSDLHLIG